MDVSIEICSNWAVSNPKWEKINLRLNVNHYFHLQMIEFNAKPIKRTSDSMNQSINEHKIWHGTVALMMVYIARG